LWSEEVRAALALRQWDACVSSVGNDKFLYDEVESMLRELCLKLAIYPQKHRDEFDESPLMHALTLRMISSVAAQKW
jgi:hypothetical protein